VRNINDDSARQTRIAFSPGSTSFVGTPTVVNSSQPGITGVCSTLFADGSGSGHCDISPALNPGQTVTIQFVINGTASRAVSAQVFSDSPDGVSGASTMANNYREEVL
jgi:hypothetical protein